MARNAVRQLTASEKARAYSAMIVVPMLFMMGLGVVAAAHRISCPSDTIAFGALDWRELPWALLALTLALAAWPAHVHAWNARFGPATRTLFRVIDFGGVLMVFAFLVCMGVLANKAVCVTPEGVLFQGGLFEPSMRRPIADITAIEIECTGKGQLMGALETNFGRTFDFGPYDLDEPAVARALSGARYDFQPRGCSADKVEHFSTRPG